MDNWKSIAHELCLYCGQQWPSAMAMTLSDANDFFSGKSFDNWKKVREGEARIQLAVIERLDGVIRSLGAIAKSR